MRVLLGYIWILLFLQCCKTNKDQSKELTSFFDKCDELNIVYYSKDPFVFKTTDTSTIYNFTHLVSGDNDNNLRILNTRPAQKLIYKSYGKIIFTANVYYHVDKNGIQSPFVSYVLKQGKCNHLLTYQSGMGISEIYAHKVNPEGNPWTNVDTTKIIFEDLRNNR